MTSKNSELPELSKTEVDGIVEEYRGAFSGINLTSAVIRKSCEDASTTLITTEWKQRNLERGTMTTIQRTLLCDNSLKNASTVNIVDISRWVLSAYAKSENLKAVIQTIPDEKNVSKNYLDVWNEEKSLMTFDLAALDLHGPIYTNEFFGTPLSWSPQEDQLVYVAEKTPAKTAPFYEQKSKPKKEKEDAILVGEQHLYEDDWGEQMSPKRQSVIAICDIITKRVRVLSGMPDDVCPGQVVWDPTGDGVVGVAFHHKPRRFGIVYCTNRRCSIFHLTLDGKYTVLSDDSKAAFSPRFSPDGKYLAWIQRDSTGPHFTVSELVKCDWATKKVDVVVDAVQESLLTKNCKKFYGIFALSLPHHCWSADSKYILFSSFQKYRINSYVVAIEDRNIWDIGSQNEEESVAILDVSEDDYIVASKTSFNQPTALVSLNLRSAFSGESYCTWNSLTDSVKYEANVIERFTVYDLEKKQEMCFATYFGPKSSTNQSIPLILYPHGGPHSSIASRFSPLFHLFASLGFGTLIVGYRGTLGYGKNFVDALLGNVGQMDVNDCYVSLQNALEKFPWLDKNRVILYGGSHGGFLVTHLSSQYPDDFISTVAVNPVTCYSAMVYATDIPEWNAVETGYTYRGLANVITDPEMWKKMAEVSPITRIKNVKTPTLLLLGKKDLRVPPLLGLSYYNMLKELNVPTKAYFYDDNHSLSSVPVEMDAEINAIIWFKRCLKRVHM